MAKSSFYNTNPDAQLIRDLDSIIADARAAAASAHDDAASALASKNAAASSQAAAAASSAAADVSEAAALASQNAAAASALAALNSQNSASASATTASTKASEASTSATNAAASASAALASKNAAATSETNAAASAAAALLSKNAAATSETNANAWYVGAVAAKDAAFTFRNDAETFKNASQAAKTASEAARDLALQHRDSSYTAEQNASNSANTAYLWAEKIDGPVLTGQYSARAWADDAKQYRNTALTYRDAAAASASAAANSAAAAATWDPSSYVPKAGGTYTGNLTISTTWPSLTLNKTASGQGNQIVGNVNGSLRWCIRPGDDVAEDGAGAGSDFSLLRFADNGTWIDAPMRISRKTGIMSLLGRPTWGATPWDSVNFNPATKASLNTSVNFVDVTASRGDNTGVIYLGSGTRYVYYDGTNYQMPGANLTVNGGTVWTSATFNPDIAPRQLKTSAQVHGGGTLSVSADTRVKWSQRFITIANGGATWLDINMPGSGTVISCTDGTTVTVDANGIPLEGWASIWFDPALYGVNGGGGAHGIRIIKHNAGASYPSPDWVPLCHNNGDNNVFYFPRGIALKANQSRAAVNMAWHEGNFNPATKLDLTGGTLSGNLTFSADMTGVVLARGGKLVDQNTGGTSGAGRTILFANNDSFDVVSEDGNSTIFNARLADAAPTFKGNGIWHAGNFDPATKADLSGAVFTGSTTTPNLLLKKPASGTSLIADVAVNISGNNLLIYQNASPYKGVTVNLSTAGSQSELWHSGNLTNPWHAGNLASPITVGNFTGYFTMRKVAYGQVGAYAQGEWTYGSSGACPPATFMSSIYLYNGAATYHYGYYYTLQWYWSGNWYSIQG